MLSVTAGNFIANVRQSGNALEVDLAHQKGELNTLSPEDLYDLQYVVNRAVKMVEDAKDEQRMAKLRQLQYRP